MGERAKERERVVVTGLGALTPLAVGPWESWRKLCQGESGIGGITDFDTAGLRTQIAGQVPDFHPADFMDRRFEKRFDRFITLALGASRMAVEDARFTIDAANAHSTGVIIGNALGGVSLMEENFRLMTQGKERRLSPFFVPGMLSSMASSLVAVELGAKGPSAVINAACASGADAIGYGFRSIRSGEAEAVLAGGSEGAITRIMFCGYHSMKATSGRNEEPQKASRPFDRDRDGFVPAEGSGVLLLERLSTALGRDAPIYAEICGYGASCDAHHITAPDPEGEGASACMRRALQNAGLPRSQVDCINAHGTSTPLNDAVETKAIKAVFGDHSQALSVTANKSMIGHAIGAAGAIEAVFSILSLKDGVVPPTINYETFDPECDLDYVPNQARTQKGMEVVLSNSFGFGGTNASLVFKRFTP